MTMRTCTLLAALMPGLAMAQSCQVRAAATPPRVVELYTSQGCSSCPPADRWLSSLRGRDDLLALAFHVTYWNSLGWPDRFADPAHTARQQAWRRALGGAYVYTPQVLVDGRDWRAWPSALPAPAPPRAAPSLSLVREGMSVRAQVGALAGTGERLAGYWALLEDGHRTAVHAGENAGATLAHDHVVRLYRPLPSWRADEAKHFELELPGADARASRRRVAFVITDAGGLLPRQAAVLPDC